MEKERENMRVDLIIDHDAIDEPGLRRTASRLFKCASSTSLDRVYGRLLDARIECLQREGRLVKRRTQVTFDG
jgi:hypothetical protein